MNEFNTFKFMSELAAKNLANQIKNTGDYIDRDGLLICGKCGEPRQRFVSVKNPTRTDPERRSNITVSTFCRCEREQKEKEEKEKQAAADMQIISKLKNASLMDDRFTDSTFADCETTRYNEYNIKLCRNYAAQFDKMLARDKGYQGLLLWGTVGTGKTYAAACIANYLLERKVPVIMTSFVKILDVIQSEYGKEVETLSRLDAAQLVIFDDLGAERSTDYALEKVYNIIDNRYRKRLPMVLTTNLTIDELKVPSDVRYARIYERVLETCYPVQFKGPSWRRKSASQQYDEMRMLLEGGRLN